MIPAVFLKAEIPMFWDKTWVSNFLISLKVQALKMSCGNFFLNFVKIPGIFYVFFYIETE